VDAIILKLRNQQMTIKLSSINYFFSAISKAMAIACFCALSFDAGVDVPIVPVL
jgi:hypothetical protein